MAAPLVETPAPTLKARKPSLWIWVPWVWLFITSTRLLSRWLTPGGSYDPDLSGSSLDRNVLIILMVLGIFVVSRRANRVKAILVRNKWLVALFLYMMLSVIWSNFPGITFRRWFRSIGTFVMVLMVLTEEDPLAAIRAVMRRVYLIHIPLSIAAIKYFRNIGVAYDWSGTEEMWVGLSIHKNNLGQVAMCSGLSSAWGMLQNWPKKKWTLDLLLFVLTMWVLKGSKNSHSSAAILGFIASMAVLLSLQFIKKRAARAKRIVLTGVIVFALLAPVVYLSFEAFDTTPVGVVLQASGRDMTFTDRTLLWTDVWNNAAKSPVLGVGFGAFWVGRPGFALYPLPNWSNKTPGWRPGEGHNGFIDVYVDLGAAGVVLLFIVIGSAVASALNDLQDQFEYGRLRLVLLLSVLMNNMAESSLLNGTQSLWFIFLLVGVSIPPMIRQSRAKSPARAPDGYFQTEPVRMGV
jgi:exopolysaccharide production protein ExoQ